MAKIETAIRDAIARGARKQVRQIAGPLRREVRRLRQALGALRTELVTIRDAAAQWQRTAQSRSWRPEVTDEESKAARLSPRLIQKLRARLGLSQALLSRLVGVSATAVVQWERGRSTPSGQNRKALVALRKLGRRDVKRLLTSLPKPARVRGNPARRKARLARRRRRK